MNISIPTPPERSRVDDCGSPASYAINSDDDFAIVDVRVGLMGALATRGSVARGRLGPRCSGRCRMIAMARDRA
jgi:hypothetical protein